jgi:TonB family protein
VKIMRNVSTIAMAFLAVSFCALKTPTVSAQVNTCALALDVATTNQNFQTRPVNGARATALNTSSHRSIRAALLRSQPVFSKLAGGEYRITVTKPGFKRAIHPLSFECLQMNADATLRVDLDPGNFRRAVVAESRSINAPMSIPPISIPPIRRGVTTLLGSEKASESIDLELEDLVKEQPASPQAPPPKGAVAGGVLNGKAISLPRPAYPPIARQAHASGAVVVQVVIDEEGNVIWTRAVSGHPLLQAVSVQAARGAKFSPTKLSGQAVKVVGVITYNFIAQ